MLATLLMLAQVATGQTVATCHVPGDPQVRTWSLERATADSWRVVFSSKSLDKPRVELPLAAAQPVIAPSEIGLSFKSANGGRTIDWQIRNGPSTLDLFVNHGPEVNVEADLDPAVDLMNTEGELSVACVITPAPHKGAPYDWVPSSEWTVAAGLAKSVNLFESTGGRAYAIQTIGWGRELTPDLGPGWVRGKFVWAVEGTPLFAQFSPSNIYGAAFSPVVWRWNFVPKPRWSAFGELAMGGMYTSDPIPEETGRANFTAHWGGGVRLAPRGGHAFLLAYRFQHFSNGNQLGSNPGVNSHVVLVGWSHRS